MKTQPDETTTWNPELYNDKYAFVYGYGEALVQLLDPQPHERILDVGCGSGQLTSQINDLAQEAIGIDHSPDMVADARAKYPGMTFTVADAADFRFDTPFDSIFSNAALHWVSNQQAAIQCMYNSLKPGGKLVLEFGGEGNVASIVLAIKAALHKRGYDEQAKLNLWYFPSIGMYTPLLEAAGFCVKLARHIDRPTELADESTGIIDWLTMFAGGFFAQVPPADVEAIKAEVQDAVKPQCLINGKWYADYKRIRIIALKT